MKILSIIFFSTVGALLTNLFVIPKLNCFTKSDTSIGEKHKSEDEGNLKGGSMEKITVDVKTSGIDEIKDKVKEIEEVLAKAKTLISELALLDVSVDCQIRKDECDKEEIWKKENKS